jgi:hypothetical protein
VGFIFIVEVCKRWLTRLPFILLISTAYCQTIRLDMKVSRNAVNSEKTFTPQKERVWMSFEDDGLTIINSQDTLQLDLLEVESNLTRNKSVYTQGEQKYWVMINSDYGLVVCITPLRPFTKELYSIIMTFP